jgi:hypothetical protein
MYGAIKPKIIKTIFSILLVNLAILYGAINMIGEINIR